MDHGPKGQHGHVLGILHFESRADSVRPALSHLESVGDATLARDADRPDFSFCQILNRQKEVRFDNLFPYHFLPLSSVPVTEDPGVLLEFFRIAGSLVLQELLRPPDILHDIKGPFVVVIYPGFKGGPVPQRNGVLRARLSH